MTIVPHKVPISSALLADELPPLSDPRTFAAVTLINCSFFWEHCQFSKHKRKIK